MKDQQAVRVLIAEDDYLVGETIKEMLTQVGYTVVGKAADGLEAIEMTQVLQPDVIIMDIEMPGVDGIEATRRIYDACPTPVVMLTAYQREELVAKAGAAGAGAYLVKPPDPRELKRTIMIAMARFDDMMALRQSKRRLEGTLAELEATQQQVIQQERLAAVGQLAAGVAHQFNNIMTSIILCADMMLKNSRLSRTDREQVTTIYEQGRHAASLTQQILDFSRRAMLRRQELSLFPFLQELSRQLQQTLRDSIHVHLTYDGADIDSDRLPPTVYGRHRPRSTSAASTEAMGNLAETISVNADPARLKQAILNLAQNAQDAMPEGGHLSLDLSRLWLEPGETPPMPEIEAGDWVCLKVTDTGTGIPPDVLPHIFEPFFTTRAPMASGLGLPQAYGVVRQHGGHMDVHTEVDVGTSFSIYLPTLPVPQPPLTSPKRTPMPEGNGETVLVIEDNAVTRKAFADSLEMLRYRVLASSDGQEALALLRQHRGGSGTDTEPGTAPTDRIQLILCGMARQAPEQVALCRAFRRLDAGVRVVVLTDHPLDDMVGKQLRLAGVVGWLQKPVSLEQLAQTVAQALCTQPAPD